MRHTPSCSSEPTLPPQAPAWSLLFQPWRRLGFKNSLPIFIMLFPTPYGTSLSDLVCILMYETCHKQRALIKLVMHPTILLLIPGFNDALLDLAVHLAVLLLLRDIHRLRLSTLRHAPLNAGQLGREKSMFPRIQHSTSCRVSLNCQDILHKFLFNLCFRECSTVSLDCQTSYTVFCSICST